MTNLFLFASRLWKAGVETSDIESEDEPKVGGKKKKFRKKKNKDTPPNGDRQKAARNFKMNPFASNNNAANNTRKKSAPAKLSRDRFAIGGTEKIQERKSLDHAPKLPSRSRLLGAPLSPIGSDTNVPQDPLSPVSPETVSLKKRLNRSTMKGVDNLASAFVTLAKTPVKLAKQPARLAVYTTKRVRRGIKRGSRTKEGNISNHDEVGSAVEKSISMKRNDSFRDCAPPLVPSRSNSYKSSSRRSSESSFNSFGPDFDSEVETKLSLEQPGSSRGTPKRREALTHTLGKLAQQPVKLAKQPLRLARYTTKQVRRRVTGSKQSRTIQSQHSRDRQGVSRKSHRVDSNEKQLIASGAVEAHRRDGLSKANSVIVDFEDSFTSCAPPLLPGRQPSFCSMSDYSESSLSDIPDKPNPRNEGRQRERRGNITETLGKLVKQPAKLARQPIRLAKYTMEVKRRVTGHKSGGDRQNPPVLPRQPSSVDRVSVKRSEEGDVNSEDREGYEIEKLDSAHSGALPEPKKSRETPRRLRHLVGAAARQPYKLAKYTARQPYRLAQYTAQKPMMFVKSTAPWIRRRMAKRALEETASRNKSFGTIPDFGDDKNLRESWVSFSDDNSMELDENSTNKEDDSVVISLDLSGDDSLQDLTGDEQVSRHRGKPLTDYRAPPSAMLLTGPSDHQSLVMKRLNQPTVYHLKSLITDDQIGSGDDTGCSTVSADDVAGVNENTNAACYFAEATENLIGSFVICGFDNICE